MVDRKQLSDLFAESPELFHRKVPFQNAFPEIAAFRLEVTTQNSYDYQYSTSVYTLANPPGEYINCSNPICCRGGFSVGDLFRKTIRERLSTYEGVEHCRGYEGSPKGRARYRSCIKRFDIKLTITFIEPTPETPSESASA